MSVVKATNALSLAFSQDLTYGAGSLVQTIPIPLAFRSIFTTYGALLDQCNLVHAKTYTFSASTPQVLDLKVLADIFGASIAFARVRLFACRVNATADSAVLLLGANGSNDWLGLSSSGSTVSVNSGTAANDGFFVKQAPGTTAMPVGSSTKLLKADPGASAFTADFLIAGADA